MAFGGPDFRKVGFHTVGAIDTCSCGLMFNGTVQSGQVGVILSEQPIPPEAVVSEVELSPSSGLKP